MCSLQHTRREAGVRRGEVLLGGPSICDGYKRLSPGHICPGTQPHLPQDTATAAPDTAASAPGPSSHICAGTRRRYFVSPTNPDAEIAKKNEEDFITIDGIRHSMILCATAATIVGAG